MSEVRALRAAAQEPGGFRAGEGSTSAAGRVLGAVIIGALTLIGCGAADHGSPGVTVLDSAGVRIVEFGDGFDSASILPLEIDPAWIPSLGHEFGNLVDVDVLSDGRAVMLDGLDGQLLLEDPESGSLMAVGRRGQGPGEFAPEGLRNIVVTDSTILVPDLFQQRLSEFTYHGDLVGTWPYPQQGLYAVDWRHGPEGQLCFRVLEMGRDRIVCWEADRLVDVYEVATGDVEPNSLLSAVSLWDIGPDGILVATSDRWAVEYRSAGNDSLVWVARGREAVEVDDRELLHLGDLLVESARRQSGNAQMGEDERAALMNQVNMPEWAPVLAGLFRSDSGDVWIREAAPIAEMGVDAMRVGTGSGYGGTLWHVVDETGTYAGSFRLPRDFEAARFKSDWIYGITEDENGVQQPARLPYPIS